MVWISLITSKLRYIKLLSTNLNQRYVQIFQQKELWFSEITRFSCLRFFSCVLFSSLPLYQIITNLYRVLTQCYNLVARCLYLYSLINMIIYTHTLNIIAIFRYFML